MGIFQWAGYPCSPPFADHKLCSRKPPFFRIAFSPPVQRIAAETGYKGTSLTLTPPSLGPYRSPMPRDLW